jgi:hypothetical protein
LDVGDADALGTGVIAAAGDSGHVRAGGLAQRQMTLERQVTVRVVTIDGGMRGLQCHLRGPQVGVQVLQPQKPRISSGVGGIADLVHPDPGNVTQPGNSHRSLANPLDHCTPRCADYPVTRRSAPPESTCLSST